MGGIEDYKQEQRLVRELNAAVKRSGADPEIVFWALRGAITDLMANVGADLRGKFATELRRDIGEMFDWADHVAALKDVAAGKD